MFFSLLIHCLSEDDLKIFYLFKLYKYIMVFFSIEIQCIIFIGRKWPSVI